MNDLTTDQDDYKMRLKRAFIRVANRLNERCSEECQLDLFENAVIQNEDGFTEEIDKEELQSCYENCVSKGYQSSLLAAQVLHQNMEI